MFPKQTLRQWVLHTRYEIVTFRLRKRRYRCSIINQIDLTLSLKMVAALEISLFVISGPQTNGAKLYGLRTNVPGTNVLLK